MSTDFPIEINPRHVRAFLDKIAADRDLELGDIDRRLREEVGEIRRRAHAEARGLARRLIDETRDRERRERDRYLYRLTSELTRERWVILDRVRERVRAEVGRLFEHAWSDPDRQYDWCRFWIASARELAVSSDLRILCGAGTVDSTLDRLRPLLGDYPGHCECVIDAARPPGVQVEWPDHLLDGTLERQREAVVEAVLARVAAMLYDDQPDEAAADE